MILIIGMHNLLNMQIKSFKIWKKKSLKLSSGCVESGKEPGQGRA